MTLLDFLYNGFEDFVIIISGNNITLYVPPIVILNLFQNLRRETRYIAIKKDPEINSR